MPAVRLQLRIILIELRLHLTPHEFVLQGPTIRLIVQAIKLRQERSTQVSVHSFLTRPLLLL